MKVSKKVTQKGMYPVSSAFVAWLASASSTGKARNGRAAVFVTKDAALTPSVISKLKHGNLPITFEHAARLERAQADSDEPLFAEDLCTYAEDASLVKFIRAGGIAQ